MSEPVATTGVDDDDADFTRLTYEEAVKHHAGRSPMTTELFKRSIDANGVRGDVSIHTPDDEEGGAK